jgi:hypothetical protein
MRCAIIGLIVGLLAMPLLNLGCADRPADRYQALLNYPATSPSGKYRLVVMKGFDGAIHFAKFDVVSEEYPQQALFSCKKHFRTWDTTFFCWDAEDRVWVYSGDIGTFYWERGKNDIWEEHTFSEGTVPPPAFLKKMRPHYFEVVAERRREALRHSGTAQ